MKAALHALDQLNSLAWQHSLHEGNESIPPQDKLKAHALDELQSSLSMPDQISADLARPLLASAVDEVCFMIKQTTIVCLGPALLHMCAVRKSILDRSSMCQTAASLPVHPADLCIAPVAMLQCDTCKSHDVSA